jgi:hypothetical protein
LKAPSSIELIWLRLSSKRYRFGSQAKTPDLREIIWLEARIKVDKLEGKSPFSREVILLLSRLRNIKFESKLKG